MITLITPTADQPTGIALCEQFMQRQTLQGFRWVVVDDGDVPAALTMGQTHVRRAREPACSGAQSFCRNLLAAVPFLEDAEMIVFIEHDDYYAATHLQTIVDQLSTPGRLIAGDDKQQYYNVAQRCSRVFQNRGASLCQTAMHRTLLRTFHDVVERCLANERFGVDWGLWQTVPTERRSLRHTGTVVGIKGLPGRAGLGVGHRPGAGWTPDPDLSYLRTLIGEDADLYERFALSFEISA